MSAEDTAGFSLRVVLVSPRNPLNIGAAARAMSNFGVRDLRLVRPYDVAFREARSAVNSQYILQQAQVCSDLAEAIADCKLVVGTTAVGNRNLHIPLYGLQAASPLIRQTSASVALLFGSEKFGLSNEDLSFCHWALRIPTREEHGSMNLGQAVAICLYELHRQAGDVDQLYPPPQIAPAETYERFTTMLSEILELSGYINERTAQSSALKLRRLVRRLQIPESDAETWLGILRQIRWKVRS